MDAVIVKHLDAAVRCHCNRDWYGGLTVSNNLLSSTLQHSIQTVRAIKSTGYVSRWRERYFYRSDLARLSGVAPHMIDDIGLTNDEVETELAKPFWR